MQYRVSPPKFKSFGIFFFKSSRNRGFLVKWTKNIVRKIEAFEKPQTKSAQLYTLRGLIFAWIKFRDFANFLAFREN